MDPKDINRLVNGLKKDIENGVGWEEEWHIREDNIIWEVIVEIANGNERAQELAKEVYKTMELNFERYYT
ncbi:hypothetical protein [Aerococcus urinaeequi]|uniref:hypothetical protein n=1 Tax=Aerococcus urinaeequi TaxID=51665 RepID=UPI003673165E